MSPPQRYRAVTGWQLSARRSQIGRSRPGWPRSDGRWHRGPSGDANPWSGAVKDETQAGGPVLQQLSANGDDSPSRGGRPCVIMVLIEGLGDTPAGRPLARLAGRPRQRPHGGVRSPESLVAALDRAATRAYDGLSLVHVPVYYGPDELGGMGVFGRWNVGNWCAETQALRHEIGI